MDVGHDRDTHSRRTLAKGLAAAALVLIGAVAAALLWRTEVPGLDLPSLDPGDYFSPAELARIDDYRSVSRPLYLASVAVEILVLALVVWKARPLAARLRPLGRGRVRTSVLVGLAVVLAVWVSQLPFDAVRLVRRHDFGLSVQGWSGWLVDELTSLAVQAVLTSIAVAGAVWLAGRLGRRWWMVGAPALVGIAVLYVAVAQPLVLQPLFNRFDPLSDRRLAAQIEELAAGMGVDVDDVLVADASRRTTTANAYVAGIGPTRRVVLYDTLLDGRFSDGEIRFVAAHELAHVERRHLWKGLAWFALLAVPGVFGLAWVTNRRGGLGPELVPLGMAFVFACVLVTQPLVNAVSRRYEAEADWLALQVTHDPASGVALERAFVRTSLSDPDPPAWTIVLYGSHPTPLQRIAMAETFRG